MFGTIALSSKALAEYQPIVGEEALAELDRLARLGPADVPAGGREHAEVQISVAASISRFLYVAGKDPAPGEQWPPPSTR